MSDSQSKWEADTRSTRPMVVAAIVLVTVSLVGFAVYVTLSWNDAMNIGTPSGLSELTVGQCFNTELRRVAVVPCSGPYKYELLGTGVLPHGPGAPFPKNMFDEEYTICDPIIERRLGPSDGRPRSQVWAPDEAAWSDGLRTVYCAHANITWMSQASPSI